MLIDNIFKKIGDFLTNIKIYKILEWLGINKIIVWPTYLWCDIIGIWFQPIWNQEWKR